MTIQEILQERKHRLLEIVREGISGSNPHTGAFILRMLGAEYVEDNLQTLPSDFPKIENLPSYGGFPEVAALGFRLATHQNQSPDECSLFLAGIDRQRQRDEKAIRSFAADDIAILGVADGLAQITDTANSNISSHKVWLVSLLDRFPGNQWSARMRAVSGDLLDGRGRLQVPLRGYSIDELSLELVLRYVWPSIYSQIAYPAHEAQNLLLKRLITESITHIDDPERAAIWLKALDILVDYASASLLPSASDTARILSRVQHSLKRWFWESQARRGTNIPAQWLIDNEYHIQAILWAILYPVYGSDLVDETYMPNWGQKQPRADLGITKLKLIIEVKYVRQRLDFEKVEEQVAGDLGLYFKDTNLFNRMIVFVYDDCDNHYPERYDSLRNSLMKRERIEDVIIVRRPSMIPPRDLRRSRKRSTRKGSSEKTVPDTGDS